MLEQLEDVFQLIERLRLASVGFDVEAYDSHDLDLVWPCASSARETDPLAALEDVELAWQELSFCVPLLTSCKEDDMTSLH